MTSASGPSAHWQATERGRVATAPRDADALRPKPPPPPDVFPTRRPKGELRASAEDVADVISGAYDDAGTDDDEDVSFASVGVVRALRLPDASVGSVGPETSGGALEAYLRMFDATTGGAPKAPAFSTIWFASAGVLVLAAVGVAGGAPRLASRICSARDRVRPRRDAPPAPKARGPTPEPEPPQQICRGGAHVRAWCVR